MPLLVDIDKHPDVAARYEVSGIPSVMVLDENGGVLKRASYLSAGAMATVLSGDLE